MAGVPVGGLVCRPNHRLVGEERPYLRPTQTHLFGDRELKAVRWMSFSAFLS